MRRSGCHTSFYVKSRGLLQDFGVGLIAGGLALTLLRPGAAEAGGWARAAGSIYVRAGAAFFRGEDTFLLADGEAGQFYSLAAELYTEVGLGQNLELDLSLRWVDNANDVVQGPTLREQGFEDLELRLKWAPVNGRRALAFVVGARQSLYARPATAEAADRPARGPGGSDLLFGASYGYSFYPTRAWIAVDVLARVRLQNPSSGVLTRVEAGWLMWAHFGAAALVELQPSFGRDEDLAVDVPAPVPTVLNLGLKVLVPVYGGFGLAAEAVGAPNVLNDGPGYRLALSLTFER